MQIRKLFSSQSNLLGIFLVERVDVHVAAVDIMKTIIDFWFLSKMLYGSFDIGTAELVGAVVVVVVVFCWSGMGCLSCMSVFIVV